jgi:ABC-type spermidine/putrescine transport system permease subunit I
VRIGRGTGAALLLPLLAVLVGFVVVPTAILFGYSLFEWVFASPVGAVTPSNYVELLGSPITRKVVETTLWIGVPVAIFSVSGGYAIAYYIVFGHGLGRQVLFILTVTALMASYLVRIYAWRTLLGSKGIVNGGLVASGLIDQPLDFILFSRTAVILGEVSLFMPLAALTFFAALSGINPDLREAARDLGASRFQTLRRVTLPLSGPAILATSALVFFLAAGDYLTPVFLGGPDAVTVGRLIADSFGTTVDYGKGAALSMLVLLGFVLIYMLLRFVMRRMNLLPTRLT